MSRNLNRISSFLANVSNTRRQVFVHKFYLYNDYEEHHMAQADTKFKIEVQSEKLKGRNRLEMSVLIGGGGNTEIKSMV